MTKEYTNRLGVARELLAKMVSDSLTEKNIKSTKERTTLEISIHIKLERAISSMLNLFDEKEGRVKDDEMRNLLLAVQAESNIRRLILQNCAR
jgi:hypothetical protein